MTTAKRCTKTFRIGDHVTWRYRGEKHATGVITGIARRGPTSCDTKWKIRSTTDNDTKGMTFEHYGRILRHLPKRRRS